MKKSKIKVITLITFLLSIVLSMSVFSACGNNYNAEMNSHAEELIDDSFLKENRVKANYLNENYIEGESDPSEKYIFEESAPSSRIIVITNQTEFNEIFSKCDLAVEFESKLVILYILADVYPYRDYYLNHLKIENKTLTVYYKLENKNIKDATDLYQRCFMLVMDKADFTTVKFTELR